MKKLGRGWQYTVYDKGDGRVLKIYNNRFFSYLRMLQNCFPYTEAPIWAFPRYYDNCKRQAYESLKEIKKTTLNFSLFGNPLIYEDNLTYEQDRIIPLRAYFRTATFEESKLVVDKFIELNKLLLQHPFVDKSFNLGANFGITAEGRVVLADIGELFFEKEKVKKQIKMRIWAKWYVLNKLPPKLNAYFIEQMDRHILPFGEGL